MSKLTRSSSDDDHDELRDDRYRRYPIHGITDSSSTNGSVVPLVSMAQRRTDGGQRIVRAAAELLTKGGLDAVSTRAVSAAAGVQPPAIYRRFGDMQGLLDAAARLNDLRSPPGNRLEALQGDRKGTYSIRINDHWRITFAWSDGGADDVRIEDYHR